MPTCKWRFNIEIQAKSIVHQRWQCSNNEISKHNISQGSNFWFVTNYAMIIDPTQTRKNFPNFRKMWTTTSLCSTTQYHLTTIHIFKSRASTIHHHWYEEYILKLSLSSKLNVVSKGSLFLLLVKCLHVYLQLVIEHAQVSLYS